MSGSLISQQEKQPVLVLTCQRDSHHFQDRTIILNDVVKVGRSVARVKPSTTNAIFDCKVLSRSHALIWYKAGRFWLRDTNSSNGTFVNNTRVVKKSDDEYADREIFSGDVIRFGVDVVEHETTHGCIIAQVSLFHPNGLEAKLSVEHVRVSNGMVGIETLHFEQMFKLTHYISEALLREQALDAKLESLKRLLQETQEVSETGWQAMLNEERLLEKLDLYESQLSLLKKDLPEDSLKSHLAQVLEEKFNLEKASKVMLERILEEKTEVLARATNLEHSYANSEKECARLRQEYEATQEAYQTMANERQNRLLMLEQLEKQLKDGDLEKFDLKDNVQYAPEGKLLQSVLNHVLVTERKMSKLRSDGHTSVVAENIVTESNALVNGLDNGLSANPVRLEDRLNLSDSSHDELPFNNSGLPSTFTECFHVLSQSADLIKSLQVEFTNLTKLKKGEKLHLPTPVTSDSDCSEIESHKNDISLDENNESSAPIFTTPLHLARNLLCRVNNFHNRAELNLNLLKSQDKQDPLNVCTIGGDICTHSLDDFSNPDNEAIKKANNVMLEASLDNVSLLTTVADDSTERNSPSFDTRVCRPSSDSTSDESELTKLRDELRLSLSDAETYKQLVESLKQQDAAKAELLQSVREECNGLRHRITLIETDIASSRADHQRLVLEAKRARAEADELQLEKDKLFDQLNQATSQVERLKFALSTTLLGDAKKGNSTKKESNTEVLPSDGTIINSVCPSENQNPTCPESVSHVTPPISITEHSFSLFAVIPVMILLCAFMAYIFLKFTK